MATVTFSTAGALQIELPLRQFDADEYVTMAEAGVFETRRRVELIGGFIVDMSPAGPLHNYVVMRFPRLFAPLMVQFEFWIQGTLKVNQRDVFDPDFMLLSLQGKSYMDALPTPNDVALLVEVSGSSLGRDAEVKRPIYAAAGIPEFWIADLDRKILIVHRNPDKDRYREVVEYAVDAHIASLAAPSFSVNVRDIFS
jgi:Uma2 family endonuclease